MIVRSEFKTFFYWFSNLCLFGGIYGLVYMMLGGFANESFAGHIAVTVVLIILLVLYGKMLWDAKAVTINLESQTILFKNRYTRKQKLYSFSYFDGYVTTYQRTKVGDFKVIYFVKDQRLLYKISRAIYSNQEQLLISLFPLKNLGIIEYSFIDSLKNLIGKKVLTK